ncbi:MAG: hypothetical protein GEV12_17340 [Micromonosporaceae bacterium]|nr:hypothetical protein [Micromonosporaceae bacterium]
MFRQNETKTRGELLRTELGESWDHALRAAGHAAGGVRAAVGPKVAPAAVRVRGAAASGWGSTKSALAPLSEAAQHGAQTARRRGKSAKPAKPGKRARRRWPKLAGLMAGGAAVGATAAYLVRRRRQQQWEDYQAEPLAPAGDGDSLASSAGVGTGAATGPDRAATPAGSAPAGSAPAGSAAAGSAAAGSAAPAGAEPGAVPAGGQGSSSSTARAAESVDATASRNSRT